MESAPSWHLACCYSLLPMFINRRTIQHLLEQEFDRLSRRELKRISRDLDDIRYKLEQQDALLRDLKSILVEVLNRETVPDFFWRIPQELKQPNVQLPGDEDLQQSDPQPPADIEDLPIPDIASLKDTDESRKRLRRIARLLDFEGQLRDDDPDDERNPNSDESESDTRTFERQNYPDPFKQTLIVGGVALTFMLLVVGLLGWLSSFYHQRSPRTCHELDVELGLCQPADLKKPLK
jgi:hypothetical protein